MALKIVSLADLKKYLETRKEMAEKQGKTMLPGDSRGQCRGMVYAFEESIKAVEALLQETEDKT